MPNINLQATLTSANLIMQVQAFTVPPTFLNYIDTTLAEIEADRVEVVTNKEIAVTKAGEASTSAAAAASSASSASADATATAADRVATGEDALATAADRVATGDDATATAADRQATSADATQTAADRVATGADADQTGLDRIATGQDATATAADRVATGQDRVAAANSADAAEASANEVAQFIPDHEAALDPHTQYVQKVAGKQLSTEDYTTPEKTKLTGIESGAQVNTVDTVDGRSGAVDLTDRYERKRFSNYDAVINPGLADDETLGYEPTSRWVNVSTGEMWLCISAATGAANWQKATLTLDELGSAAMADVGTGADHLPRNSDLGSASQAATTDFEPVGTVAAHEAKEDPHAQYTTDSEAVAIATSRAITFAIALG